MTHTHNIGLEFLGNTEAYAFRHKAWGNNAVVAGRGDMRCFGWSVKTKAEETGVRVDTRQNPKPLNPINP